MAAPMDFWRLVKEVNPRTIRDEAERAFTVAGLGNGEDLAALRRVAGLDSEAARSFAAGRWVESPLPVPPVSHPAVASCRFALTLAEDGSSVPVVTWKLVPPAVEADVRQILDRMPDLMLALPRYIPLFRREAVDRIIAAAAKANAELALASALPGVVPWTAALLPATAFPDMVLLTKNQGMMCLRIAAVYGFPVEPKARLGELSGVIGAAFGWRALAREVVGLVPGGVGAGLKSAVAYAATVATGRAAQALYASGRLPPDPVRREIFRDAFRRRRAETTGAAQPQSA